MALPGAPTNKKELRAHPDKEGYLNASREEIEALAGDEFNTIKVVPASEYR